MGARRLQFSLRSILLVMTGFAFILSMVKWQSVPGTFLFMLGLGVALIWLALWLGRVDLVITGLLLMVAAYVFLVVVAVNGH